MAWRFSGRRGLLFWCLLHSGLRTVEQIGFENIPYNSFHCNKHDYCMVPNKLRSALKHFQMGSGCSHYLEMNRVNGSNAQEVLERLVESFGVDPAALGEQSESVWGQLNDLHEINPGSYQS